MTQVIDHQLNKPKLPKIMEQVVVIIDTRERLLICNQMFLQILRTKLPGREMLTMISLIPKNGLNLEVQIPDGALQLVQLSLSTKVV